MHMFHRSLYSTLVLAAAALPLAAQQRTEVYAYPPTGEARLSTTYTASRRAVIGVTVTTRPSAGDSIGATIAAVTPGGPAAKAGILAGDIIVKFNGTTLVERRGRGQGEDEVPAQSGPGLKLIELVSRVAPGDTVTVEWRHERQRKTARLATESAGNVWVMGDSSVRFFTAPPPGAYTLELDLSQRQRELVELRRGLEMHGIPAPGHPMERVFLRTRGPLGGVQFAPINADLGRYFGVTDGILILDTPDTSAHIDFKGGDVIVSVDGRKPVGVEQLMRILGSYDDGETVSFEVMRDKRRVTVAVKAEDVRGGGRMKVYDAELAPVPAPTTAPRARTPRSGI
jgi:hypothetical protein